VHQRQVQRTVVQAVQAVAIVPSVLADHAAQQNALHGMSTLTSYEPTPMQMEMAPAPASGASGQTAQQQQLERQRLLEQDATASTLDLSSNFAMDVPPHAPSQPLMDAAAAAFGADDLDDETTAGEECWAEQVMSSDWLSTFEHQASVL